MSHTKHSSRRPTLREEQGYLFLCLLLLGVALVLQHTAYLLMLAAAIIGLTFARSTGKRWLLTRRLLILSFFILLSILPIALGRGEGSSLWIDFGGCGVTKGGSVQALKTGLRCLASASSMMLLLQLLPLHRLYTVLRSLVLPSSSLSSLSSPTAISSS